MMKWLKQNYTLVIVAGLALLAVYVTMPGLFETFRMSDNATCPECQDDSDCVKCGFKNSSCDKSSKKGGLGTCIPRGSGL